VETISERASAQTWTCEITMQAGRLPDPDAIARHILATRTGAKLRGVEATVVGTLATGQAVWTLVLSKTGETVELAPLRRKVQWDVKAKREQALTPQEKRAWATLRKQKYPLESRLEVIGPLEVRKRSDGTPQTVLQVRAFRRLTLPRDTARPAPERRGEEKE
jgi:hypothetical protein